MRTLLTAIALLLATPVLGGMAIVASYLGLKPQPGNFLDLAPKLWARIALRAAGVDVVLHGLEHVPEGEPHIYVSNHVSWFDVLALAAALPHYRFVAKAEIFGVPIFGRGALAVGTIPIERENRKAAFESYKVAADRIREGASVVVYPEGTRGREYALRPFKKGPFVLAIAAKAPVVPVLVFGAREVMRKGSFRVHSNTVHVHFLESVETEGLGYDQRHEVMRTVWERMATCLRDEYGIESREGPIAEPASERTA